MSVLNDTLKSFSYYKNKLPLYLQNSDGFISHFRLWYDLLIGKNHSGILPITDEVLDLLNIFDENILEKINSLPGAASIIEGETVYNNSDFLDKLASLFGLSRKFSCTFLDPEDNTTIVTEELFLDNEELLMLIKCQIINNYSDGTYEQIKKFYDDAGLYTFVITDPIGAMVDLILGIAEGVHDYSDNIKKMFNAGLLTVKHMGIGYRLAVIVLDKFLIWDNNELKHAWDNGLWGI